MKLLKLSLLLALLASCTTNDPNDTVTGRYGLEISVPGDFKTIQGAIDAAQAGDTIVVGPGDYYESLQSWIPISLKGAGPGKTVVHGSYQLGGMGDCEPECQITGFTFTGDGEDNGDGIDLGTSTFKIYGNVIEGFQKGITMENAGAGKISGNVVRQNSIGISFTESVNVEIFNNLILNNSGSGLRMWGWCAPWIKHNTIVGNGFGASFDNGGAGVVYGKGNDERLINNIIVSNKGGVNTMFDSASSVNSHNLVWGNATNYVGQASPSVGDVSKDPRFVNAGEKDYRLAVDSPALDVGTDAGVTVDFDGNPRPVAAAPDLGAYELQEADSVADLVITEVLANPVNESKGEFVELYNPADTPLDAAGLVLSDGDATDQIVGYEGGPTIIPAAAYAVILDKDYGDLDVLYDIPQNAVLLSVPNAALGSGLSTGDEVTLARNGAVVSSYYHPFNPGNGLSAERLDPSLPDEPGNWVPSPCGMSPGKANCIGSGEAPEGVPTLVITEVMVSPLDSGTGEFVEVYNFGDDPVELTGLKFTDGDAVDSIIAVAGKQSMLGAGQLGLIIDSGLIPTMQGEPYFLGAEVSVVVTVDDAALGNALAKNDPISILMADGVTAISTYSHPVPTSQQSVERTDPMAADVPGSWIPCPCADKHSAGRPNCAYGSDEPVATPKLLISEIMANPLDEDKGEFIELFNPGHSPVDGAGLVFSDGDTTDIIGPFEPAGSTIIPAGGYAVILDPEYDDSYSIPEAAILLAPGNTTVGNGLANNDPVTLYASDGLTVLSSYSFPFNAGNGLSVERKDQSGDTENNWVASTCASGSSPGASNCAGGGEPEPQGPAIAISEVMANPAVESTEEFVEIVNLTASAIDLAGYMLSDGDAVDPLLGFDGGTTVLPAGAYGVILDSGYPVDGPYQIPAEAVLLTTDDASLGSGLAVSDPVTLLEPDGITVASTFGHPFNPGNGLSIERIDPSGADIPENWVVSPCASGSSPGQENCAGSEPVQPGITVVEVNSAAATELEQVTGIGPATAAAIVQYREANGPFESLTQLCVIGSITLSKVAEWKVAADGDDPFVLGLEGAVDVLVHAEVSDLLAELPAPDGPDAAAFEGRPVRINRAVALTETDSETAQVLLFGDWGDGGEFEPQGTAQIGVYLAKSAGEGTYNRSQTDHANAMADWDKEDGDPYLLPDFYRWSTGLAGFGEVPYAHVFALEGVLQVYQDEWQIRIRARDDAGIDRLVMVERWLVPYEWKELQVIWTYSYKSVVVKANNGFSYSLPYRLAMAHPCRDFWLELWDEVVELPKCVGFGQCAPMQPWWNLFNDALSQWKEVPPPNDGYCFTYSVAEYCFSLGEEEVGLEILNNATFVQLLEHCYTSTLANIVVANRPYTTIAGYDGVSGVGGKSLWNLLVCYVRSGDWPPGDPGTVLWVLQGTPENEYDLVKINIAEVTKINSSLATICDPGTEHCMKVWHQGGLPPGVDVGSQVEVQGWVKEYADGEVVYWEIEVTGGTTYMKLVD